MKDQSPERAKRKEKEHEDRAEEKKKEKKIKEKKKKKDGEDKEKKRKKKKEKRATQKELKEEAHKAATPGEAESLSEVKSHTESSTIKDEEIVAPGSVATEESTESATINISNEKFEDTSFAMNPEPPEVSTDDKESQDATDFCTNPPNPNFKPIPEIKANSMPLESLYGGLDDTEIITAIPEKYSTLSTEETDEDDSRTTRIMDADSATSTLPGTSSSTVSQSTKENPSETCDKSPKKDDFLAQLPELSKWEREDTTEKFDAVPESPPPEEPEATVTDESKTTKVVTSEVLKRAENAIFQKAINAIRPIEIKKISESRKILYQNPEPKIMSPEPVARETRKSVNVTINVGRNERNVEITEPVKKSKLDRTKFKPVPESHSPTRLSAKERLGDKVDDEKERKVNQQKNFLERRDSGKTDATRRGSRSPKNSRERRVSPLPERRVEPVTAAPSNSERKVFLDDRKRERDRNERPRERNERHDARSDGRDNRVDFRSSRNDRNDRDRGDKERERSERRPRTPPAQVNKREDLSKSSSMKRRETTLAATPVVDEDNEKKKDKKPKDEKKRKKEHRSRSKSKDRKRRKDKKHKRDKDKSQEKKQKHKDGSGSSGTPSGGNQIVRDSSSTRDKPANSEVKKSSQESQENPREEPVKKQRKNPRLVSDRKRSVLDESSFEPDYSASDSDTDNEEKASPTKKPKLEASLSESITEKTTETKSQKKRAKSPSSDDDSTSDSESSSSDTDSSEDSHRKRKKKHKKHRRRKARKDSSSDSDSESDSSDSSSDDKHKKKSKKSKSRSKLAKKKKKAKHK